SWRLFLTTGVLGGFTTFSTFSLETVLLFERGQPGGGLRFMRRLRLQLLSAAYLPGYASSAFSPEQPTNERDLSVMAIPPQASQPLRRSSPRWASRMSARTSPR